MSHKSGIYSSTWEWNTQYNGYPCSLTRTYRSMTRRAAGETRQKSDGYRTQTWLGARRRAQKLPFCRPPFFFRVYEPVFYTGAPGHFLRHRPFQRKKMNERDPLFGSSGGPYIRFSWPINRFLVTARTLKSVSHKMSGYLWIPARAWWEGLARTPPLASSRFLWREVNKCSARDKNAVSLPRYVPPTVLCEYWNLDTLCQDDSLARGKRYMEVEFVIRAHIYFAVRWVSRLSLLAKLAIGLNTPTTTPSKYLNLYYIFSR